MTTLSNTKEASAAEMAHADAWVLFVSGESAPYQTFAKDEYDRRGRLSDIVANQFPAATALAAAEADVVVVGALVVTDNSGDADYTTTQAAVTALQEKLDALIAAHNTQKNFYQPE